MIIDLETLDATKLFDELFPLFELDSASFTRDVEYSDSTNRYLNEIVEFGAVHKDDMYVIPAGLRFRLVRPEFNDCVFDMIRNGIRLDMDNTDDLCIEVELTDFGRKCETAAKRLDKTIFEVKDDIAKYSEFFNIS